MKKKAVWRIIGIGIFHTLLYGWSVPFVIYPKFCKIGAGFAVALAVVVSVPVLGTLLSGKGRKEKNE